MIVSVARRTERASQGILYTWQSDRVGRPRIVCRSERASGHIADSPVLSPVFRVLSHHHPCSPPGVSSVCAVHHAACFASNSAHVAGRPPGLLARAGLRVCTLFRVTSEGSSPPGAMDKPVLSYAQTGDLLSQGLMLRCTERMIVYVARRTERVCGIQAHVDRFELPPAALLSRARFGRIALPSRTCVRLSCACHETRSRTSGRAD